MKRNNTTIKYLTIATMKAKELNTTLTKNELEIIAEYFANESTINLRNKDIYNQIKLTTENLIKLRNTKAYNQAIAEIKGA